MEQMNIIGLGFYVVLFPILLGFLMERCCNSNMEIRLRYWWEGFLMELFLFYFVHRILMLFHEDFIQICNVYIALSIFFAIIAMALIFHTLIHVEKTERKLDMRLRGWQEYVWAGIFLLFFLIQIVKSGTILEVYPGDETAAHVSTIVSDASLFQSNPLTGMPYETGQVQAEYSSLAVFYAFLVNVFHVNTIAVVYKLIPVWFLCLFYSIQYSVGMELFSNDKKKAFLYCSAISAANIFGTRKNWIVSAFLLLYPWTKDTVLVSFILPVSAWMLIKLLFLKEKKRVIYLLLISMLLLLLGEESFFYVISIAVIGIILVIIQRTGTYD